MMSVHDLNIKMDTALREIEKLGTRMDNVLTALVAQLLEKKGQDVRVTKGDLKLLMDLLEAAIHPAPANEKRTQDMSQLWAMLSYEHKERG